MSAKVTPSQYHLDGHEVTRDGGRKQCRTNIKNQPTSQPASKPARWRGVGHSPLPAGVRATYV
ncbi:hypothetical protein E2C01_069403 [Portunus trituberculatus]|uniref:Uncharacterized protein n=1 Tax=Portunus trituberculatus TaxID=210409 RepID=A0A5B7HRH4_PORTR|nr:hypothetical protein [Portunus trituberculatus]